MFNRPALFLFACIFFSGSILAQKNGLLPLTGLRYFQGGVWAKNIDVNVDGSTLLSDRVPLNKEIEIKLQIPSGFASVGGLYFPAAEVTILSAKGGVISKAPNVFAVSGVAANAFKEVKVKIGLRPEVIKQEASILVQVRFYDLKSANQLRLEFPVSISKTGEILQTSKNASVVKASDVSQAVTNVLKIKKVDVTVDTAIRVNPKMAYVSLDIPGIEATSMDDVLAGTETFWVYDNNLNSVKTNDKLLKKVGGSMESSIVNYILKIPYKLKTVVASGYIVRFRWESKDHQKIFDIVVVR